MKKNILRSLIMLSLIFGLMAGLDGCSSDSEPGSGNTKTVAVEYRGEFWYSNDYRVNDKSDSEYFDFIIKNNLQVEKVKLDETSIFFYKALPANFDISNNPPAPPGSGLDTWKAWTEGNILYYEWASYPKEWGSFIDNKKLKREYDGNIYRRKPL